jgi:hypothetical protein
MLWVFLYSSDKNQNGRYTRNVYHKWKDNIEMDLTERTCECTGIIQFMTGMSGMLL